MQIETIVSASRSGLLQRPSAQAGLAPSTTAVGRPSNEGGSRQ